MISIEEKYLEDIISTGHFLDQKNLCPATSGNISIRVDENNFAITVSGKHKGSLIADDIIIVDKESLPVGSEKKPSAEALLHLVLYNLWAHVGAVIHTHSLNGTVLSMLSDETLITTKGYEIHKAFPNVDTHLSQIHVPIFENSQEMSALSQQIADYLQKNTAICGYFLRGHGLYTWGKDIQEAKIRVEAYEFLFACEVKIRSLK